MEDICRQMWLCGAMSPEWPLLMPIAAVILVAVPVASILRRAGRSGWWTILAFVPLLNLIFLWVFAFSRWPAVDSER